MKKTKKNSMIITITKKKHSYKQKDPNDKAISKYTKGNHYAKTKIL